MMPPETAILRDADGLPTFNRVAAAGSVPAGANWIAGFAVKADGSLYAIFV